jgi:hypothetical protein
MNTSMSQAMGHFSPMSSETSQLIHLKGGATLHKYQDGKMAYENAFGRPVLVKPGEVFTAVDGSSIRMVGNEVARLSLEIYANSHG